MTINNVPNVLIDTSVLEAEIDNLQTQIDEKATINHEHQISNIDGLATALFDKADKTSVTNTVSVLEAAIGGKADNGHTQPISTITGLQTALNNKVDIGTIVNAFNYDGSSIPSNPTTGQTWRERKSNGTILRDWEYDGTDWISLQDFTISNLSNQANGRATAITTSATTDNYFIDGGGNFYMDELNKGILIKNSCLHLSVASPSDVANYWRIRLYYLQTGNVTILPGELFTSDLMAPRTYDRWINHEKKVYRGVTLDTGLHGIRPYFRAFGSPANLLVSLATAYKLIR